MAGGCYVMFFTSASPGFSFVGLLCEGGGSCILWVGSYNKKVCLGLSIRGCIPLVSLFSPFLYLPHDDYRLRYGRGVRLVGGCVSEVSASASSSSSSCGSLDFQKNSDKYVILLLPQH